MIKRSTATLGVIFVFLAASLAFGQSQTKPDTNNSTTTVTLATPDKKSDECSMENMGLRGAHARMAAFNDTIISQDSAFRQVPCKYGWNIRVNMTPQYKENMLQAPVGPSKAVYTGQSMYWQMLENPIISWDMRQFHFKHAQLSMAFTDQHVEWEKGGPSSLGVTNLYFYQDYFNDRLEVKGGYILEHYEFIGLQTGGAIATSSLGVYSVMPYQLGMSRNAQAAPAFNARVNMPYHFYSKTGIQRSLDPNGITTNTRNPTGLIFVPHGYKELIMEEFGYDRKATAKSGQLWIRGGYMNNQTPLTNKASGKVSSGDWLGYALADYQIWQKDKSPTHGLYLGGTYMKSSSHYNANDAGYEVRAYLKAPFKSRPYDQTSIVLTYSTYSADTVQSELKKKTAHCAAATSATYSYGYRIGRGLYANMGATYQNGQTNTPRLRNSLLGTMMINMFF